MNVPKASCAVGQSMSAAAIGAEMSPVVKIIAGIAGCPRGSIPAWPMSYRTPLVHKLQAVLNHAFTNLNKDIPLLSGDSHALDVRVVCRAAHCWHVAAAKCFGG